MGFINILYNFKWFFNMRKFKKKIIEEDLIIESNIENTEEKEGFQEKVN